MSTHGCVSFGTAVVHMFCDLLSLLLVIKLLSQHRPPFPSTCFASVCSNLLSDLDYGLVWKVQGYDDRFPEEYDLGIFDRVGVYGSLKGNNLHDNYMGACERMTCSVQVQSRLHS